MLRKHRRLPKLDREGMIAGGKANCNKAGHWKSPAARGSQTGVARYGQPAGLFQICASVLAKGNPSVVEHVLANVLGTMKDGLDDDRAVGRDGVAVHVLW